MVDGDPVTDAEFIGAAGLVLSGLDRVAGIIRALQNDSLTSLVEPHPDFINQQKQANEHYSGKGVCEGDKRVFAFTQCEHLLVDG